MKSIRARLQGTAERNCLSIALGLWTMLSMPLGGRAQTVIPATKPTKDPKLVSLLCELRDSALNLRTPEASAHTTSLQIEKLPTSVRNALFARTLRMDTSGAVQLYIEMDDVSASHLEALRELGATIQLVGEPSARQSAAEAYTLVPTVEATAPPSVLSKMEALPFVRLIRLPDYGVADTGSVDTQGDSDLGIQTVRNTFGLDGTNVTIGVISSGIAGVFESDCTSCGSTSSTPSPMTLGDLPLSQGTRTANVLTGVAPITIDGVTTGFTAIPFPTDGDLEASTLPAPDGAEGTAMLEVIHDLAPNATLIFANGPTAMDFEMAVNYLAAHADVVVDDRLFLTPPYDGTSAVSTNTADALNNDSNKIRAYITSVGNFALNHYEESWNDSHVDGTTVTNQPGDLHLFQADGIVTSDGANLGPQLFDPLVGVASNEIVQVYLSWNDPTGASSNDYDLFLVPLSCKGTPVARQLPTGPCTISGPPLAYSANMQSGTQNPVESLSWQNPGPSAASVGLVIQNANNLAQTRTFDMFLPSPYGKESVPNHNFNTVGGSVGAQSDAGGSPASVISVGAISAGNCQQQAPDNCVGLLESFSGQGPTQATPQAASRMKPDLIAVDQVCVTGAGGFGTPDTTGTCQLSSSSPQYTPHLFTGTSAAAPHVASVAALLLQAAPCLLNSSGQVSPPNARTTLTSLLLNNADLLPGYSEAIPNTIEGHGLVDAYNSTTSLLPTAGVATINGSTAATATLSATSSSGVPVEITGPSSSAPISGCTPKGMQWSGSCGTGSVQSLNTTLSCPIGVNTVRVNFAYNGTAFLPTAQASSSTIIVTDFTLASANSTSTSIPPGGSAVYVITASSLPQGQFGNPIALTCGTGLPPGATCSFSAPTLTISSASGATSNLTIYTSGQSENRTRPGPHGFGSAVVALCLGCPLTLLCVASRRSRRSIPQLLVGCLALTSAAWLSSCTTSTSRNATVGNYTVTVLGTSNQLQHTTTVSLVVQ